MPAPTHLVCGHPTHHPRSRRAAAASELTASGSGAAAAQMWEKGVVALHAVQALQTVEAAHGEQLCVRTSLPPPRQARLRLFAGS